MHKVHMGDRLLFGNPASPVGILTLWTKKERIADSLQKDDYCILGNLYSRSEGISTIIRNCLRHKTVRYIIVCGVDLNNSGAALISLSSNGVDKKHRIVGFEDSIIDKNIPIDAIERFCASVQIIDYRKKDTSKLHDFIAGLEPHESWGEPEEFPYGQSKPEVFPTDLSGFKVTGHEVDDIIYRNLHLIKRFGVVQNEIKEVLNVVSVYFPNNPTAIHDNHYKFDGSQIIGPKDEHLEIVEAGDNWYVLCHIKQLDIFRKLKHILMNLASIVSQEAMKQKKHLVSITVSCIHAFHNVKDTDEVNALVSQGPAHQPKISDPRGNLVISVEDKQIKVLHLDIAGNLMDIYFGKSAMEVYKKLAAEQTISDMSHTFDIGCELQKAEIALELNIPYEQDQKLKFK